MDQEKLTQRADAFDANDQSEAITRAERVEPSENAPMIVTSLRLPEPVMREVRRLAEDRGMKTTQSEVQLSGA